MVSLLRWKASLLLLTLPIILNFIFIPLYLQNSSTRYQIYGLHFNLWRESGSTPTQKNAVKPTSYHIPTPQKKAVWILILFRQRGKTLTRIYNLLYGLLSVHHLPSSVLIYSLTVHTTTTIGLSQHCLLLSPALFSPEFLTVHNVV